VRNQQGDLLEGIRVRYEESDGTLIAQGETNASGEFSYDIDVSLLPILGANIVARLKAFKDYRSEVDIPTTGFDVPIAMQPDPSVDLP
jgi:hypothetical protein